MEPPAPVPAADAGATTPQGEDLDSGRLPDPINDLLAGVKAQLQFFSSFAPHTIQRLAELILSPRAHYKALVSYLHAVDRVVRVTSGTNTYPLPPAITDMSTMAQANGGSAVSADSSGPSLSWSNPTTATAAANASLGSDDALGGALLTPISWLRGKSPESNGEPSAGAQIHSEGTETIDGPNGVGSIETVSVSVNGVPSTGHSRGVTQGELLRQEQRAGVVPVNQLARSHESPDQDPDRARDAAEDDAEIPHARGPDEIGVDDTGPQSATSSHLGEGRAEARAIDVEAAVGRKQDGDGTTAPDPKAAPAVPPEEDPASPGLGGVQGTKREADQHLESETPKRLRESSDEESDDGGEAPSGDSHGGALDEPAAADSEEKGPRPDPRVDDSPMDQT